MSEYDERTDPEPRETAASAPDGAADDRAPGDGWEAPTTGDAAVDDVLVAVQALDNRPVEEHVAVFEQAHERLRRALDPGHG